MTPFALRELLKHSPSDNAHLPNDTTGHQQWISDT
jgi:hypothetical protein